MISTLGAWAERDPAGYQNGSNLYEYTEANPITQIDPAGLRATNFGFNAFIHMRFGPWIFEPGIWGGLGFLGMTDQSAQFSGDNRGFGTFIGTNARLFSTGSIQSTRIGTPAAAGLSGAGTSQRRTRARITLPNGTCGWGPWSPPITATAAVSGGTPIVTAGRCWTKVQFTPSASYPFMPSPDIDYSVTFFFQATGQDRIVWSIIANHNAFPDYEGYVDGLPHYQYSTLYPGPDLWNMTLEDLDASKSGVITDAATPATCPCPP